MRGRCGSSSSSRAAPNLRRTSASRFTGDSRGAHSMAASNTTLKPVQWEQKRRFVYLFLAQVLLLVLFPYLETPGLPTVFFRLLGVAAFLSCIYAVSEKRAQWITALALALPAGVLNTLYVLWPSTPIAVATLICSLLFLAYALVSLLGAVLRAEEVTPDIIYGGASVYLLMAVLWGTAYLLLETVQPGAFSMDPARH